jgi:hypothetical protein
VMKPYARLYHLLRDLRYMRASFLDLSHNGLF